MAMELDRYLARPEFSGNLLIKQPRHDQRHHLPLAWREIVVPAAQLCPFLPLLPPMTVESNRLRDSLQQILIAEGLGEKLHRPCFHCPDCHRDVTVTCDENDREMNLSFSQLALQFESAQPGQPHIEYQAAGTI